MENKATLKMNDLVGGSVNIFHLKFKNEPTTNINF